MITETSNSAGFVWTSDQPDTVTSTQDTRHSNLNARHTHEKDLHAPTGFEPAIPASERSKTHALDRAATRTGFLTTYKILIIMLTSQSTQTPEFFRVKVAEF